MRVLAAISTNGKASFVFLIRGYTRGVVRCDWTSSRAHGEEKHSSTEMKKLLFNSPSKQILISIGGCIGVAVEEVKLVEFLS